MHQKRVTAVTPTVLTTLKSHCSAHPTVKAKALSDRTDNPEQNPTKNGQKPPHTRPYAPVEVSASRARAPRAARIPHELTRPPRAPLAHTRHTRLLCFTYYHVNPRVTSHCHASTRHPLTVDLTKLLIVDFDR